MATGPARWQAGTVKKRTIALVAPLIAAGGLAVQDLLQTKHALRRNFPLVARLRQGDFPLIVLRFDPWNLEDRLPDGTWASGRWSDAMAAAVRHAYRVDERWKGFLVLRPRGE